MIFIKVDFQIHILWQFDLNRNDKTPEHTSCSTGNRFGFAKLHETTWTWGCWHENLWFAAVMFDARCSIGWWNGSFIFYLLQTTSPLLRLRCPFRCLDRSVHRRRHRRRCCGFGDFWSKYGALDNTGCSSDAHRPQFDVHGLLLRSLERHTAASFCSKPSLGSWNKLSVKVIYSSEQPAQALWQISLVVGSMQQTGWGTFMNAILTVVLEHTKKAFQLFLAFSVCLNLQLFREWHKQCYRFWLPITPNFENVFYNSLHRV